MLKASLASAAAGCRALQGPSARGGSVSVSRPVSAVQTVRPAKALGRKALRVQAVAEAARPSTDSAGGDVVVTFDNDADAKCTIVHITAKNKPGA